MMHEFTLLDGGMGRELKRTGAPFDHPFWSAQALWEAPEAVYQAHCRFIEAGAQIITVNSYACVPFHLGETRYREQGPALAAKAANIARQAVDQYPDKQVQIAGSLPPPMGSYRPDLFEPEAALEVYQQLLEAQAPFCDLFLVETLASLEELRIAQAAAQHTAKPVHYAFSLQDEPAEGARLRSGQSVASAVALVCASPDAAGISFNCSVPEVMAPALSETLQILASHGSDLTVGVYANNFIPIPANYSANSESQPMRELSAEAYLQYVKQWADIGATLIGGCCGIGPEHIRRLAEWQHC